MTEKQLKSFMDKVTITETCWLWSGAGGVHSPRGYGLFTTDKLKAAHRVSYEHFSGSIPDGQYVMHTCDVKHCVNPEHLQLGTPLDNSQDYTNKYGSPYAGDNHYNARLKETDVLSIIDMVKNGVPNKEIVEMFCVNKSTVCDIVKGRTWNHVTGLPYKRRISLSTQ